MIKTTKFLNNYTAIHIANNDNFFYKIIHIINTHRKMFISFCFLILFFSMSAQTSFLQNQKTYSRVSDAFIKKENILRNEFLNKGLNFPPLEVLLVAYKAEGEFEVWVKQNYYYKLFKVYEICKKSGDFGPKRAQGDRQVPEGLYYINVFNPNSDYHLSLGISYPNFSDRVLSSSPDLGGDIYIHGDCVTVGCLPMTDDLMKEIYILNTYAKGNGQDKIPIYLFPFKFNKLTEYIFYKEYPEHVSLWNNLKDEYYYFTNNKQIRNYSIDSYGKYLFYK